MRLAASSCGSWLPAKWPTRCRLDRLSFAAPWCRSGSASESAWAISDRPMTEGQGTAADRGRPSFLVGVEVISERDSAVCDSTKLGIFPQREAMAGGSSREGLPTLLQTGSKATVSTCPTSLRPVWKQTPSDFTLPEPCEFDILLVCQHPHALSRERLVPALAGRTNAARPARQPTVAASLPSGNRRRR